MSSQDQGTTRREFFIASAGVAAVAAAGFSRIAVAQDMSGYVSQMIHFTLKDGQEEKAMAFLKELTGMVEKHEPDVLVYVANRDIKDPKKITFYEVYKNQAAAKHHTATKYFRAMMPKFGEYFEKKMVFEPLQRVAGFTRRS